MATRDKKNVSTHEEARWPFGRKNYILFGVAMLVIIVGFIFLSQDSIDVAPALLILGYCVLIPISLAVKDKSVSADADNTSE